MSQVPNNRSSKSALQKPVHGLHLHPVAAAHHAIVRVVTPLIDLLLPPECLWCNRPISRNNLQANSAEENGSVKPSWEPISAAAQICCACRKVFVSRYYRCQACALPLPNVVPNSDCSRCRQDNLAFEKVVTLGPYRSDLQKAVIQMKKKRHELLREAIAELLYGVLLEELESEESKLAGVPVLVPVPNHWTRRFVSVADVAGSLAAGISRRAGWRVATDTVRRVRRTAKQGMLSWSDRTQNVRGAFAIRNAKRLLLSHVFLVDDVMTSGATANELAKVLRAAGAAGVTVVVAARGVGARESTLSSVSEKR